MSREEFEAAWHREIKRILQSKEANRNRAYATTTDARDSW